MRATLFIITLLCLCLAEVSDPQAVATPWLRTALLTASAATLSAGALLGVRRIAYCLRMWPGHAQRWGKRFRLLKRLHFGLWVCHAMLCIGVLQWPAVVQDCWRLRDLPLLSDLLILAPIVSPLVFGWAVFLRFHDVVEEVVASQESPVVDAPLSHLAPRRWVANLGRRCREELALTTMPLLLVLFFGDLAKTISHPQASRLIAWIGPLAALTLVVQWMPRWLEQIWQTQPLGAGALRERLDMTAERLGLSSARLSIATSSNAGANAAAAGMIGPMRTIFLSRSLLQQLSPAQVEAVYCHEAAHVKRRHLLLRAITLALPTTLALATFPTSTALAPSVSDWLAGMGYARQIQLGLILPMAAGAVVAATAWIVSWAIEFDADLWALQQLESPEDLAEALDQLAANLPGGARPSWLHPSLDHRSRFARWAIRHANRSAALSRCLGLAGWLAGVGFVGSLAVWLLRH